MLNDYRPAYHIELGSLGLILCFERANRGKKSQENHKAEKMITLGISAEKYIFIFVKMIAFGGLYHHDHKHVYNN